MAAAPLRRNGGPARSTTLDSARKAAQDSTLVRIGVDLGGTKIEAVGLDPEGRTLARVRRATPRDDYDATLEAIVSAVAEIERAAGERGSVGVGMPGALSRATGRVKNSNSTWLNGRPLAEDLEGRLG